MKLLLETFKRYLFINYKLEIHINVLKFLLSLLTRNTSIFIFLMNLTL